MSALFPFPKSRKRTLPGKGSRDQGIDGEECLPSIPQSFPSFIPREFLGWGVDSLRGRMSRRLVVYRQTTTANGIASNPIPLPVPSTIAKDLSIFSLWFLLQRCFCFRSFRGRVHKKKANDWQFCFYALVPLCIVSTNPK
ncbi:hypothetical protein TNIN_240541 [Trichonephila inaurata madagascariensis]|uniref:Uncharacterized protein n=1 Tax=Trichonephila inaurata madagascariensis TaxID=2747483 RepID=A0A8X6XIT9_9ARAC|nr:hypothetical protein TNIN_240541 [Trichonephila inaurata madagascariensis]